jgi:hypothetical protein
MGVIYERRGSNFEYQQLGNLLISFRPEGPPLMRSQGADPCSIVDLSIGGALDSSLTRPWSVSRGRLLSNSLSLGLPENSNTVQTN